MSAPWENLSYFLSSDGSEEARRIAYMIKSKKRLMKPQCLFPCLPVMNQYHALYALFLKELSEHCYVSVLAHDQLLPLYLTDRMRFRDVEECLRAFDHFLLQAGVKEENFRIVRMSNMFPTIIRTQEFWRWLSGLDMDRASHDAIQVTATVMPHDATEFLSWCVESFVAVNWNDLTDFGDIDFVLIGEDRRPLYDLIRKGYKGSKSYPSFLTVKMLFKGRKLVLRPWMSLQEASDAVYSACRGARGGIDDETLSAVIADLASTGAAMKKGYGLPTADLDIGELPGERERFERVTRYFWELLKLEPIMQKPPPLEKVHHIVPCDRVLNVREMDWFIDFVKKVPCRYLLKLIYTNPGRTESEYRLMLQGFTEDMRLKGSRVTSGSTGTVSTYLGEACDLQLVEKRDNRYYPRFGSLILRLGKEELTSY